jgi:conjugative relaxase-like TrwC/TraI family protein
MMTVHVLHASDGYTYLTRQVASGDVPRRRGEALTDYYTAGGNPPGRWIGSGRAAMGVDGQVSEAQMRALFGAGLHPDAQARIAAAVAAGQSREQAEVSGRLGRPFPVIEDTGRVWRDRVQAAYQAFAIEHGRRPERGVERDLIRWNVASELFSESQGRAPADGGELKRFVARLAKPGRQPVAGVDLVFTPVKSVSVLWALGDDIVRRHVEAAHETAWQRAFAYVEREAALTRTGKAGVAQVDTNGLVAAAFDHPDSRTGDPNLHTHVAVSAKVQGTDGRWRALDMRVLHAMAVSASEAYNTAIEDELRTRLGVRFVDRTAVAGKRPVREIDGIPPVLLRAFSTRRAQVESGYEQALARYRDAHGHDPPRTVQYRLAQEATLAGRPDKPASRSWADARAEWLVQTHEVLRVSRTPYGRDVEAIIRAAMGTLVSEAVVDEPTLSGLARRTVETVAQSRSTWTRWHLRAEAHRVTRSLEVSPLAREGLVDEVTSRAVRDCLELQAPDINPAPAQLTRRDGASVYTVHGSTRYTSQELILAVEDRLLAAAQERTTVATAHPVLDVAAAALEREHGWAFDTGQVELARSFVCDDRRVVVGIGPAGTGKTTAMRMVACALAADGRRMVAVAPSARAAAVLRKAVGVPATTTAKLLHEQSPDAPVADALVLRRGDVLLVDEAGMAGTPTLGRLLDLASSTGAVLRLLGDPRQLSAVEAGGALRLLAHERDCAYLSRVHRFADPAEAKASMQLRRGQPSALGFYEAHSRLHSGSRPVMLEQLYEAWRRDNSAGSSTVMVCAATADVAALSSRARRERVAEGAVEGSGLVLRDGTLAGVGDVVVTRRNDRRLAVHGGADFVKNGDLWRVTRRHPTGDLDVAHLAHGATVRLSAEYAATQVELGYATTVHRAQGMTVDTAHVLVDAAMSRESLYVAMSRGRAGNHAFVVTDEILDVDLHRQPAPPSDAVTVLTGVLARESSEKSATETIRETLAVAESLATLVPRYLDALARIVVTPQVEQAVRAGLRQAGGAALEAAATESPGWHRLVLACAGKDPHSTAVEAVHSHLLDPASVDDVAGLLAGRAARLRAGDASSAERSSGLRRPPWLPPPVLHSDDPIAQWAWRQDQLVIQRVSALVEQIASDPPPWAASIPARPTHEADRLDWDLDVGIVAAYRDQHGIPPHVQHPEADQLAQSGDAMVAARLAWSRLTREATSRTRQAEDRLRDLMQRPAGWSAEVSGPSASPARRAPQSRPPQTRLQPGPRL